MGLLNDMNNMNLSDFLYGKIIIIPAILLAFAFHEFAHAKVSDMLGDKTPRFQGRLTLNPASHLDPLGTLLIFLVGFGWAKPVETNPRAYKNYYMDDLKVSIAGPLANLFLAFVGCLLGQLLLEFSFKGNILPAALNNVLIQMLYAVFVYNVNLFVFNLLPIPGLDGFWILRDLKPDFFNSISDSLYRYQSYIWLGVLLVGGRLISIPVGYVMKFILMIVQPITGVIF